ncbi:hypothetical protein [Georgenia sp. MJ170]|uniref:hypothetical protein n=1 Tax=Georgenia sunbinii TaxID=3117728 RepID=UPI002F2627B5
MATTETHARHLEWWQRVRTLQETQRSPWPTRSASSPQPYEDAELSDEALEVEYL